jgi:hypothetical protein
MSFLDSLMNRRVSKNILAGAGSALNLFPDSDYAKHVPRQSAQERMRGHFERTGEHLRTAMKRFDDEQKQTKK